MSNNQVMLVGRVMDDPKIKYYKGRNGRMIFFDLVTSPDPSDGPFSSTRLHVAVRDAQNNNLASRCMDMIHAGKILFISGKLRRRCFVGRDLTSVEITEVNAQSICEVGADPARNVDPDPVFTEVQHG